MLNNIKLQIILTTDNTSSKPTLFVDWTIVILKKKTSMVVLSIISRLQKKMTAFICRYQILNQISDLTGNSSGQKIKFQNQMENRIVRAHI